MKYPLLLSTLLREHWVISPAIAAGMKQEIRNILSGQPFDLSSVVDKATLKYANRDLHISIFDNEKESPDDKQDDVIAIIGLRGTMVKYGDMCSYGTEDVAQMLFNAYANDGVQAVILSVHSGGGTTSSVIPLEAVLKQRNKPVIALVDNMADSAAYYTACMCDEIWAVHPMAEVGSIGVMTVLVNDKKKNEMEGYDIIHITADESEHKNAGYEQALQGNTEIYKQESLKPWAIHFQNHVREFRAGKLDENVEGLLSGKVFYAQDAVKNGLIDSIGSVDTVIKRAYDLAFKSQIINNLKK